MAAIYTATKFGEARLHDINYPHPALYHLAYYSLWAFYSYAAGLVATGIWVIAHGAPISFPQATLPTSPQNAAIKPSQNPSLSITPWGGFYILRESNQPSSIKLFISCQALESHTIHGVSVMLSTTLVRPI